MGTGWDDALHDGKQIFLKDVARKPVRILRMDEDFTESFLQISADNKQSKNAGTSKPPGRYGMKTGTAFVGALVLVALGVAAPLERAFAQSTVTVPRQCKNGVCGSSKYYGGRVRITLSSQLSRTTHFNFKTNPGAQIEVPGRYDFDQEPGRRGTYSAQACDRGGLGARSTCTQWATFVWSSGR